MATLPSALVDAYTEELNRLSSASRRTLAALLLGLEYESVEDLREKVLEIMEPLCAASSETAAAMAAEFYDQAREQQTGSPLGAVADSRRVPGATEGAVRALIQLVVDGKPFEQFVGQLQDRVDFETKRAAGECVKANAASDPLKPGWARVPSGAETCGFCLMLASRGFVYTSAESAGSEGHYHPNCDCRIVPGFGDIEGYDPDEIYERWKASEHAEYMSRHKAGARNRSTYKVSSPDGLPSFESFNEVKAYLYEAESEQDLAKRFSVLGNVYGFGSAQMRSQSLKNVAKTASKKLKP